VQFATTQKLARYWGTDYDWRKVEARLNALPQFITNIDGLIFISFTCVRKIRVRCRSSLHTGGPVRSLSS
jgi:Epoxide hydrolase N terminus